MTDEELSRESLRGKRSEGRSKSKSKSKKYNFQILTAALICLAFLTLTVPHSFEILSHFEKPDTHWLGWFYALGLEVGAGYAAFIVCERGVKRWTRVLAGIMLTGAISGSYLLNLSYYLANGASLEHAIGLAALLPGFIALLGGMLPGLRDSKTDGQDNFSLVALSEPGETEFRPGPGREIPVSMIDPLPLLQEALAAMQQSIDERMAEIDNRLQSGSVATQETLSKLPELVQSQVQSLHYFDNASQTGSAENAVELQSLVMSVELIGNRLAAVAQMLESLHAQMHSFTQADSFAGHNQQRVGLSEVDFQALAKTMGELGRKVQRRDIGIAEFDKRVAELLNP